MKAMTIAIVVLLLAALGLSACSAGPAGPAAGPAMANMSNSNSAGQPATVSFTLKTGMADGKMAFTGVGGKIDGMVNPTLQVNPGDTVAITLVDGDGIQHDISFPDFNATSSFINSQGSQTSLSFTASKSGTFAYFCTVPGHRQAGMEGQLIVGQAVATPVAATAASISRDPTDLPGPIGNRPPQHVRFDLEADEVTGQLSPGVTYRYWTFNGKVPGPFLRVRVGDTVEVHLKNPASNTMSHSIDLHAVLGPGGGALMTETPPGGETSFTFKALNPGLFVYHCATPMAAEHIANGMYGLILVEPEGGLAPVDHEFYVMQGEIYTNQTYQQKGLDDFSLDKLMNETPEFYVFNGATDALTTQFPLHAKVGETVRIFFGDGGPNKISSFHVIGEILDRVYDQGSLTSPPLTAVQTTLVPPGGATVIEIKLQVPGRFMLVDHALVRMERGLSGYLMVDGPANPDLYLGTPQPGSGH
ncbi:MAG: copper-containing nitrite reductase [Negativicutes bacterium]|nr:copper-containing nitrite reductase [Negativicutes bacterium]MDR3588941.1 copper-containing nitrite reductase [Negativicutes bacterium]